MKENAKSKLHIAEESFVSAALDPLRWDGAMDMLAEAMGVSGAVLAPFQGRFPGFPHSARLKPGIERYFKEGWVSRDERERGLPLLRDRGVVVDLDITSLDEIARNAFWQELLIPSEMAWFVAVGVNAGEDEWCLSLQRTESQGPFLPSDASDLLQLAPQVSIAATFASALARAEATGATRALDELDLPAIGFDRAGRVAHLNAAARLENWPEIRMAGGKLTIKDRKAMGDLESALAEAVIGKRSGLNAVRIPRPHRAPLMLQLTTFGSDLDNPFAPIRAIAIVRDPERRITVRSEILTALFSLTQAEAALASRLATGEELAEAAESMNIGKETARTHLKRVFRKTHVSRQSELMVLLSRIG